MFKSPSNKVKAPPRFFLPEQRRRYSPQFKAESVQIVIETGKPIAVVARDLGIHDATWVTGSTRGGGTHGGRPEQHPVEAARVREMEDDIGLQY